VPLATQQVYWFAPTGAAPAKARRMVRESARLQLSAESVHTAELLVSELVTNAITHGSGQVVVTVDSDEAGVLITVGDSSSEAPLLQPEQPLALGGRGLRMIETLAAEWGITPRPEGGKDVWFRLP